MKNISNTLLLLTFSLTLLCHSPSSHFPSLCHYTKVHLFEVFQGFSHSCIPLHLIQQSFVLFLSLNFRPTQGPAAAVQAAGVPPRRALRLRLMQLFFFCRDLNLLLFFFRGEGVAVNMLPRPSSFVFTVVFFFLVFFFPSPFFSKAGHGLGRHRCHSHLPAKPYNRTVREMT